jgi:hypothetical protein
MAEHSINLSTISRFKDTRIMATSSGCMECISREAVELHPDNMNGEGFSVSKSWMLLLQTLKEQKKPPFSKEEGLPLNFYHPRISPFHDPSTLLL